MRHKWGPYLQVPKNSMKFSWKALPYALHLRRENAILIGKLLKINQLCQKSQRPLSLENFFREKRRKQMATLHDSKSSCLQLELKKLREKNV